MSRASLLTLVKKALLAEGGFHQDAEQMAQGVGIVLGVSGGPDSMALLQVLSRLRQSLHFELLAFSVDHGLRSESADEVLLVKKYCAELGVPCSSARLKIEGRQNLQARARELRFEQLFSAATREFGAQGVVATAHHRRDRVETVLLRLLRGTSLSGLNVLPVRSEQAGRPALLRPMIAATREQVDEHMRYAEIPSVVDPSNHDPHYMRVRVRNELLPLLRELSPNIEQNLETIALEAAVLDAPLLLSRDQRQQLRRALLEPKRFIDLRLPDGLRLVRKSAVSGKKED